MLESSMTTRPAVSIGLPVYNGEEYICTAIESALAQSYNNIELIISDNNSTDKTEELCLAYAATDPRVKYFRQNKNIGPHGNFHFVATKAEGELFTWLAHDDILEPDFISEAVEYILPRPEVNLVTGDFKIIGPDGNDVGVEKLEAVRGHLPWESRRTKLFRYYPVSNSHFCIYGLMRSSVCRSVLQSVPEPKLMGGSEFPILTRIAVQGQMDSVERYWRKYRITINSSVSKSESIAMAKRPPITRIFLHTIALWERRCDQLIVLMTSSLSLRQKGWTAMCMISWYIADGWRQGRRAAVRLIRTGTPWTR
jgi:glycosyltransferase involved in cell wall biosynthesis